ncbi:MAG: response regulator [Gemmatimonadota bacterium]
MSGRARILIVDDEPFNVDYLEQELADLGYETLSASDGQQAVELVRRERPDLVLLDVMMPVMDGFTACRILKDDEDTRLTPIVIMTALDRVEDRVRGIEAGADDFLTKPVDDRELVARIQTTLRLKQTMDRKLGDAGRLRDHYARFVPEPIRRLAVSDPQAPGLGEKVEEDVTVLFGDVTGYTRLSEQLPAEHLNALVERYFSAFLDRIREAEGDINETAGDGFMAIFQGGEPAPHAARAVEAALALVAIARDLAQGSQDPPLELHFGIASGTALVGATRFAGSRGERWTFTASGPVTNLARRLVDEARAGQVVVSPETARRIAGLYQLESLGPRQLKNLSAPVEAHRVLGSAR